MREEEKRSSSKGLLEAKSSDLWINIKLLWLLVTVLLCINLFYAF